MNDPANAHKIEQLETASELLMSGREDDEATDEVSVEQSLMAIQILRNLGRRSIADYNPRLALRKELGIPRDDEEQRKLFGETFERLCEVSLVRVNNSRPDGPKDSRSAGLTFLGKGAYRELFGREAPVSRNRKIGSTPG